MQHHSTTATPSSVPNLKFFVEKKTRLNGLVREIYIARGWLRAKDKTRSLIEITSKGLPHLQ